MVNRLIKPLLSKSFFLFGARGTGKSTWLRDKLCTTVEKDQYELIDLLNPKDSERFCGRPEVFSNWLNSIRDKRDWIVIDEVQKEPKLLDVVHHEIENHKKLKFALTGSSSRKLKRGGANLLAGRAGWNVLFPFTHLELGDDFNLNHSINFGSLPALFKMNLEEKEDFLRSYVQVYLREEIFEEQLVRNTTSFRKFLDFAAQMDSKILNYSKIARDANVENPTIKTYFDILEDTYLGFRLPGYSKSIRKQQTQHPKFYFFDQGVKRAILKEFRSPYLESTSAYGNAFESFLISEFYRINECLKLDFSFSYLHTKDDAEIDLIVERAGSKTYAIEIKSYSRVDVNEVSKLEAIAKDLKNVRIILLSNDPLPQKIGKVECLHWKEGIKEIFEI